MTSNGKPVLVATDLSARSDRAVDRAALLARQWGVRLLVFHALEAGSQLEDEPELAERAIRAVLPNPMDDVAIVPAIGPAPVMIAQTAEQADCGLIVTGVARLNHVGDYLTGTAVDHVVRHATVPVLVVKQRPHRSYASILVATDFSDCSRLALLTVAQLFPDAALHLVHAYHVPYDAWTPSEAVRQEVMRETQEELDAFAQDPAIPDTVQARITPHLGYGELLSVVRKTAEDVAADLVAVGTHGRSGFVHAIIGSMAEEILRSVSADTLMVREQR